MVAPGSHARACSARRKAVITGLWRQDVVRTPLRSAAFTSVSPSADSSATKESANPPDEAITQFDNLLKKWENALAVEI
jgi:hypothetical protein